MSARKENSKRPAPANEHTETPFPKRPRRSTATGATSEPTEEKRNDFTVDQRYWIRLHHYLMRQAVINHRSLTALEGTVSCAYFNAYWQGYLSTPRYNIAKPKHAPKTYKEFNDMRQELIPNVIKEIFRKPSENAKDQNTTEYRPVIVPSMLTRFRGLWDKIGVKDEIDWDHSEIANEFNEFFDNIVREQTELTQPAWVTAGRQNLFDRPTMEGFRSYADYVSPHFDSHFDYSGTELEKTASDSKDVWRIIGNEGKRENFPMRRRKAHADAGNALLNMAIMRPAGYLGDLRSLGKDPREDDLSNMSEDQKKNFHDHMRMLQQGNDLQRSLYKKAGLPVKENEDDEKTGEDEDGDVLLED